MAYPQHQPGVDSFDDSLRVNLKVRRARQKTHFALGYLCLESYGLAKEGVKVFTLYGIGGAELTNTLARSLRLTTISKVVEVGFHAKKTYQYEQI